MKKYTFPSIVLLLVLPLFAAISGHAQAPVVQHAAGFDVSIPLRDMKPAVRSESDREKEEGEENEVPNKFRPPYHGTGIDNVLQINYTKPGDAAMSAPIANFAGITNAANAPSRYTPPDPAGDVGPNHYVEVVNVSLEIFSKGGTSLYGPVPTSTIWTGFNGNWYGHNNGDAIVLYDENADRWIISQFAIDCPGTPKTEYELIAVSTTGDPTGSYYRYAFEFDYMPDYPKLGVWQDGYYMAINRFNTNTAGTPFVGGGSCVMERTKMLTGDPTASMIYFKTETLGGSGSGSGAACYSMLPSDCDGTLPPTGTSNYFAFISGAELRLWALHTDWTTPASSTFTFVTALPVTSYSGIGLATIPQAGTSQLVDGLGDRLMFRNQYRNFGSYETFVTCHSISANSKSGIRWYEYRKTGSTFSMYQQSTYAPNDGLWRWMASIAMNANGDIGMAYSVSSSTTFPSIYYTGRKAGDPLNTMNVAEGVIQAGTASISGASRWGDYTAMNIDPVDNQTFWTTQEYIGTYGGTWPWATKIASFKISGTPAAATAAASSITLTGSTLNGTVNPEGLSTTSHFEWGTTTSYGNSTATVSAGSGSSNVASTAAITGLTAGTTYHFRVVGSNSEGTTNGTDLTFMAGGSTLTTTAASAITSTTATTGGTVSADGGATVTARGVCWSSAAGPTTSDMHTTDGAGTGTFSSNITFLTPGTFYHLRAYATNSTGTAYGNEVTFTTSCGSYGPPFSESFTAYAIPGCWTQSDHQGNGEVWQFGNINSNGANNPSLTNYYAYLNSNTYGAANSQNADLITPTLDLSLYSGVYLKFNHYFRASAGSSATLSYSINNGTSWTQIQQWTSTTANPAAFNQVIAAVAGQNQVKFKWNYTGSNGYYWAIDDIVVSVSGLWIGGSSGAPSDWNTASNWDNSTLPTGTTNIWIPSRAFLPVINNNGATCNNLVFGSNGLLTINPGKDLTVGGTITMNGNNILIVSNNTGTGSLIDNGIAGTGTATVQRYLSQDTWHYVSAPISDAVSGTFLNDYLRTSNEADMRPLSDPDAGWGAYIQLLTVHLPSVTGWAVWSPVATSTATKIFTGVLNTGTKTLSLTRTIGATYAGWTLAGNPYPSATDWTSAGWTLTHVDPTAYLWNGSQYVTWNRDLNAGTAATKYIPAMQGFFVHVTQDINNWTTGSIGVTNAARVNNNQSFYKDTLAVQDQLSLVAEGNGYEDRTMVWFRQGSTPEFDWQYDAYKLFGISAAPQLYSILPDEVAAINILPRTGENQVVPLGFKCGDTGTFSITASGTGSFEAGTHVFLEDKQTGQTQDLTLNPRYPFQYDPDNVTERFALHFNAAQGIDGNNSEQGIRIYAWQNQIFITRENQSTSQGNVYIYDLLGKLVKMTILQPGPMTIIPVSVTPQILLVKVVTPGKVNAGKVMIR